MALQPQIVLGNGAQTTRRFMELAAASTSFFARIARSDDAPLPPPADFDPRFGSQVNVPLYRSISNAVMYFGNVTSEVELNGATIPAFFLLFFNRAGDFYLNPFGIRSAPYRTLDPYYPSPSGLIAWQGLQYETVAPGLPPRYFDVLLSREPSVADIQLTLDLVIPLTSIG